MYFKFNMFPNAFSSFNALLVVVLFSPKSTSTKLNYHGFIPMKKNNVNLLENTMKELLVHSSSLRRFEALIVANRMY